MAHPNPETPNTVMRVVPWNKLRKNEDESIIYGPLGTAFSLREGEAYLSVTWCEYFAGNEPECIRCAALETHRGRRVGAKARFVIAKISAIENFWAAHDKRIRFVHEPEENNAAHAALRRWPNENQDLLERLASEVWNECLSHADIEAFPKTECLAR